MSKCVILALIKILTSEFSLPNNALPAMIQQESAWDNTAVSPANARGLMQLTPIAVKAIKENLKNLPPRCSKINGKKVYSDPETNVLAGACYFKLMLQTFDNIYPIAIAAYNGGPGRVKEIPWPKETRGYIRKVMFYKENKQFSCKK